MSRFAPAIIVFEKRPRWETELKRELAGESLLVRPCRSPADLTELARAMPGSVVVLDIDEMIPAVLRWLEQALQLRIGVLPLVIAPSVAKEMEWPLRELGALAMLSDTVRGEELAATCRRMLAAA